MLVSRNLPQEYPRKLVKLTDPLPRGNRLYARQIALENYCMIVSSSRRTYTVPRLEDS